MNTDTGHIFDPETLPVETRAQLAAPDLNLQSPEECLCGSRARFADCCMAVVAEMTAIVEGGAR